MINTELDQLYERRRGHWRENRRWSFVLLGLWHFSTLGLIYWPDAWDFQFLGWNFSFWLAAQGILLFYWLIVATYSAVMLRADRRWGLDEPDFED